MNLKQAVKRRIIETCVVASLNLRRVASIELTWQRIRMICKQISVVF
jgi:hypothetical protein